MQRDWGAKLPSFDGGLMASFSALPYPESVETRPLGREHRWMVSNHLGSCSQTRMNVMITERPRGAAKAGSPV